MGDPKASPKGLHDQLRVEFIGDSITAGWVVLNSPGSYINQNQSGEDIFQTWDRRLADAWGTADWRAVARTGIAIFPYQAYGLQFYGIRDRFLCSEYSFSQCCRLPWDFGRWQADVVVINVGTNDYIPINPLKPEARNFQAGYEQLLAAVRAKYPGALIFCLMPLAYTCDADSRYDALYQGLTEAVRGAQDEMIQLHTTGTREAPWLNCITDYVDRIHPTVAGGRKFAERLLPVLTPDVRRFFPQKCGGSGPRCEQDLATPSPTRQTSSETTTAASETSAAATTASSETTTAATTGRPSSSAPAGGAECCYPDCADAQKVCNTESESPFCTSSPANCRQCGGELCSGQGSQTTASPTVPTTAVPTTAVPTTVPSTSAAGTTTRPGSTSTPAGGAECCYPDCADSQKVCNTERDSPFCTSSAANCRQCGGELCLTRAIFP
ncbi:celE [Symbiodinium natans]|uniref:CelE protein n=1 Tax=Symbiodinium natans TaxID=878477 RepID=A0A812H3P8_9DINO|nr:celE [Symbiodinium natans]